MNILIFFFFHRWCLKSEWLCLVPTKTASFWINGRLLTHFSGEFENDEEVWWEVLFSFKVTLWIFWIEKLYCAFLDIQFIMLQQFIVMLSVFAIPLGKPAQRKAYVCMCYLIPLSVYLELCLNIMSPVGKVDSWHLISSCLNKEL